MKIRRLGCLLLALCLLAGCGGSPETTTQTQTEAQALPQLSGDLNIYCFQAGKADAFLFWNEAGAVLLDTGESGFGKTIVEKLGELGIEKLLCLELLWGPDYDRLCRKLEASEGMIAPVGSVISTSFRRFTALVSPSFWLMRLSSCSMESTWS